MAALAVARSRCGMTTEEHKWLVDKPQRVAESSHVAQPNIVHRDVGRKG